MNQSTTTSQRLLDTFHEVPLHQFRQHLAVAVQESLQAIVVVCHDNSSICGCHHYPEQPLYDLLYKWLYGPVSRQQEDLLQCVLDVLLLPQVLPTACHGGLVHVLLELLLCTTTTTTPHCITRNDWSVTQQQCLEAATRLLTPSLRLSDLFRRVLVCATVPSLNTALSVIKYWMNQWQQPLAYALLLPLWCDLLSQLDAVEANYLSLQSAPISPPENERQRKRRRRRRVYSNNPEDNDEHEDTPFYMMHDAPKKVQQPLSVQHVLTADTRHVSLQHVRDQLRAVARIRTKCLKALQGWVVTNNNNHDDDVCQVWLSIVRRKCISNNSALSKYIRLSFLFWSPNTVCRVLQDAVVSRSNWTALCLLTEVCVEYSSISWEAVRRVVTWIDARVSHDVAVPRCGLQYLAFLVAYRGPELLLKDDFLSLLTKLSNRYETPEDWLMKSSISPSQYEYLVEAMLGTGLFGLLYRESQSKGSECPDDDTTNISSGSVWFYDPMANNSIRNCGAYTLSALFGREHAKKLFSIRNTGTMPKRNNTRITTSSFPFFNTLSDELMNHIFSFLRYKRILQIRRVCSRWKSLADGDYPIWWPLYQSRYDTAEEDLLCVHQLPWKQLFIDRWTVERSIRFQRTSCGWKVRLCPRVGCLTILSTPKRMKRHSGVHKNNKRAL